MKRLERSEMKNLRGGVEAPPPGCGMGGDFCGTSSNGVVYTCCTSDRKRVCVSEQCDEPDPV